MPFRFNFLVIVVPHTYSRSFEILMLCLKKLPLSAVDMLVSCVFCRLVLMDNRNDPGREIIHTASEIRP